MVSRCGSSFFKDTRNSRNGIALLSPHSSALTDRSLNSSYVSHFPFKYFLIGYNSIFRIFLFLFFFFSFSSIYRFLRYKALANETFRDYLQIHYSNVFDTLLDDAIILIILKLWIHYGTRQKIKGVSLIANKVY